MGVTTKKQEFIDRVKGKPIAKDMFGQTISLGDWFVWGAGSQSSGPLNFGRVVKINYNKENWRTEAAVKVSSVTVIKMEKVSEWRHKSRMDEAYNGYIRSNKKQACQRYDTGMVMDGPPNRIAEKILGDIEVPKE